MRLSVPGSILGGCAIVKAVDVHDRLGWVPAIAFVVAGLACLLHDRWGAGLVASLAGWSILGPLYSHNGTLLFWMAATFAIFPLPEQRGLVVRAQLTILYAAAGLGKLNSSWLSGSVLEDISARIPAHEVAAMATVAAELVLAVALWSRRARPVVVVVGLMMHLAFAVLIPGPRWWLASLAVFNALAAGMLWWSTSPAAARSGRTVTGVAGRISLRC